ncbi:glycosyltransferase [Virgibacillus halodenitrificans]|uniref:glycosyltransferase family 4 protein n=1 Tax=Virgibacillus halodenitrificans TaxID=1482 RepID=UPI00136A2C03|nr:glycosyltransferase family 4 protein [Virgibacillus halodenitrificans]MYL47152.1 glycosyltransferase [Virgibacillus halodenitrificans]
MKKGKVLFLVNHDVVIYNFRRELVERLLAEGFEVYISSPYGERIDDLIKMGCRYLDVDLNRHGMNIIQELGLLRYYKKITSNIKPDVVLTYTIKPNIYGGLACKSLGVPYIANITGLGSSVVNGGVMQKVSKVLYKLAFKDVSKVFFQNKSNQQFFIDNNLALGKHCLLPGSGVNLKQFSPLLYSDDTVTEFVFISRIMKEKGIDQYLDAAKHIKKKYPDTIFHVLGFCEERYENTLHLLHNQGIIQYHGMQRDVREFLSTSHCTIHPSFHEGMSNVLLESAASARPIITTNVSGCKEIVDDNVNGYLVEKENSEDLIMKIEQFLNLSLRQKEEMGKAGRKKVEKEFNRDIIVNAYMKEIKDISNLI